uniref:hypothetical protein n=1 Tax=Agathobacter sp. TaxID=2021311 RepID=UPI0040575D99
MVAVFLLLGCGAEETDGDTEEVSSELRFFGDGPGLNVERCLKESGEGCFSNLQSPDGKYPHVSGGEGPWEMKQPKTFADLAYFYNLQWIQFGGGIEVPSLEPLCKLSQLEKIEFSDAVVTDEVFEGLLGLPKLKGLYISNINITEEKLETIGKLPMLTSFELGHYDYVYGVGTNWGEITDGSLLLWRIWNIWILAEI